MRRHKLLPARGKEDLPLSCAGPGLKGNRERASAEGLGTSTARVLQLKWQCASTYAPVPRKKGSAMQACLRCLVQA